MILIPTAYFQQPPTIGTGCTATSQEVGYTYYYMQSSIDVTIPQWTVRVKNTVTASMGGAATTRFGAGCFSCNAQQATASFGGAQANQIFSNTKTNGSTNAAFGLPGFLKSFSSESCYVDSWEVTSGGGFGPCSAVFSTAYGGTFSTATAGFMNRDLTKYNVSFNGWGNQPFLTGSVSHCATYAQPAVLKEWINCSGTSYTGSEARTDCLREYQQLNSSTALVITGYYSGSCT